MKEYLVRRVERPDWSKLEPLELAHTGWLAPNAVKAKAWACHDGDHLYIRMEAEETNLRATLTGRLDQVCDDSCLEFFFAPLGEDRRYFNFEFNPLGTLYLGFGGLRPHRVRQIVKDPDGLFAPEPYLTDGGWGILFRVPARFINTYFPDYTFSGVAGANFYKCGDRTESPHYLAWSPLTAERPDYHRRDDFGLLRFE